MCFFVLSISNMKYVQSITYKLVGESKKIIKSTPNAYFSFDFPVKFVSKKGIFWENGWFPLVPRKIWVISLKIFKTDPIDNTWLRRNSGEVIFLPQHTSKVNTSELPKISKIQHGGWKMAHQATGHKLAPYYNMISSFTNSRGLQPHHHQWELSWVVVVFFSRASLTVRITVKNGNHV